MSDIYCKGRLLDLVQRAKLYDSSKTFVDKPMSVDPDEVVRDFKEFIERDPDPDVQALRAFVDGHFLDVDAELEHWDPDDWNPRPALLDKIGDPVLRDWASELNKLWKFLGRKIKTMEHPERHSLLPVKNPFIIPGDRFREFYYWDTYWIVGGLLAVGMETTVRGMLGNFLDGVDKYGFVPNGGRVYYIGRSQPPLLTPMVNLYFQQTNDKKFLAENVSTLEKEREFWIKNRTVDVRGHEVARYGAETSRPRPEGYREDLELTHGLTEPETKETLSHVVSACESGWDFSTRWFSDGSDFRTIKTRSIAPVDLNVYLCWGESLLADFYRVLGHEEKEMFYRKAAELRKKTIDDLFWDNDLGAWFDLDLDTGKRRTSFYPSNIFPLMANCTTIDFKSERNAKKILEYIKKTKVTDFPGGIPTSLVTSEQQWDFPNAWSPLVHFFVESLASIQLKEARTLADEVAKNWILSNFEAWNSFGREKLMYEKYSVDRFGEPGGGGEYDVQVGFGWTNGVILMWLDKYGKDISSNHNDGLHGN